MYAGFPCLNLFPLYGHSFWDCLCMIANSPLPHSTNLFYLKTVGHYSKDISTFPFMIKFSLALVEMTLSFLINFASGQIFLINVVPGTGGKDTFISISVVVGPNSKNTSLHNGTSPTITPITCNNCRIFSSCKIVTFKKQGYLLDGIA